ncbi:MAG: hemolysin family protein [Klebsiella sp.]|nr:hemolysin family protein [Klebsiella sp.]
MLNSILVILCLIAVSAFFSISEISLAASRKIKLKLLADEGNVNAQRVLKMQENPGTFFTVVQIGLNAVAILGGIVGDAAFSPAFHSLLSGYMSPELSEQLSFIISFTLVTSLFILFADLTPKRIGMIAPETVPMRFCLLVFRPLVWLFNGMANMIFRIFKLPMVRKDDITSDDIYAVVEAGALAGVLRKQEHELIENVFELESRTVPSSMTSRENVIWFDLHEDEQSLKNKVAEHPHSKFLVCNEDIDHIIGYVDSKDLLNRVLANQSLVLTGGVQIRNTLIVPDTLTLSEALESFKTAGEDFAVIMNEYALVVGIITLNENSWLIDGGTPIDDVMRVLDIDEFPQSGNYETIGGFMMFMLRKIPKRTDAVKFSGYKFEVVDIDNYRIDQLLVTRIDNKPTVLVPKQAEAAESQNA